MIHMKFSIITASFNSGEKLRMTLNSILNQDFQDFEITVKDGGSIDGSVELVQEDKRIEQAVSEGKLKFLICPDRGVYDGMNQAILTCRGDYVLFLNCGDTFHDKNVLRRAAAEIEKRKGGDSRAKEGTKEKAPAVFYGNTFRKSTGVLVHSSPKITGFTCYRNIPCHQSCFYDRRLFRKKKYDLSLKVRADYDHFLWCYYKGGAEFHYMDFTVSDYEGGGISESDENKRQDKEEHELVIRRYMPFHEILKYKFIMFLTFAPLRRWIAESSRLSGIYHKIKDRLYRRERVSESRRG